MTYQFVTFKDKKYNIDDEKTAKNLAQMQEGEIQRLKILIEDYKHLLEEKEKAHKECIKTNLKLRDINKKLEKDYKEKDKMFGECLDDIDELTKENTNLKDSIKMFFRLNENIIKEF